MADPHCSHRPKPPAVDQTSAAMKYSATLYRALNGRLIHEPDTAQVDSPFTRRFAAEKIGFQSFKIRHEPRIRPGTLKGLCHNGEH